MRKVKEIRKMIELLEKCYEEEDDYFIACMYRAKARALKWVLEEREFP